MPNIMTHISRDLPDPDGFWKRLKKWLEGRFPGWTIPRQGAST